MQLGIALPQIGDDATPQNIANVAVEAETIGLDSVWVIERLLRPTRPIMTPWGPDPMPIPDFYANVFDPLETLAYAAALTSHVRLGTSALNALLHPPVVLGKRLATLDRLSGGRVIAGLAQGWMNDEFAVAGVPRTRRGAGMTDYVGALRTVWADDPVHYSGTYYEIAESQIGPKPVRPDGIPILIAASATGVGSATVGAGTKRAGRLGVGLNPYPMSRGLLAAEVTTFRAAARAAGHDADALPIVVRANAELTDASLPDDRPIFAGTIAQWADDLAFARSLDIDHVLFHIAAPLEVQLKAMTVLRDRVP